MDAKKIAILHYTAPPVVGGVELVVQHHARLFANAGYAVTVMAGKGELQLEGVELTINPLFDARNNEILAVKAELDKGEAGERFNKTKDKILVYLEKTLPQLDLVIAHNLCSLHKNLPLSTALYEFLQKEEAPALVAWHHDIAWENGQYSEELYDRWPWDLLKKPWHEKKQIHVAVSEMRRQEIKALFGISQSKITIIPSGLEWEVFLKVGAKTQAIIAEFHLMNATPLFLLPVNITRNKNIELAMKIMFELRKEYPRAALVVTGPAEPQNLGSKTYFEELLELCTSLNMQPTKDDDQTRPQVIFLAEYEKEYLPDEVIADLYRFADALLFPSKQEGFGIPILEAGMAGLPVFCSDIPPFRETAENLALYFDLNDSPRNVAQKIITWLETDTTIKLKNCIKQSYTWKNIFKQKIKPLIDTALK